MKDLYDSLVELDAAQELVDLARKDLRDAVNEQMEMEKEMIYSMRNDREFMQYLKIDKAKMRRHAHRVNRNLEV